MSKKGVNNSNSLQQGIVYKSTGSWYIVKNKEGQFYQARLIGKFKVDKDISSTNPIAVGDRVQFDLESGEEDSFATIRKIEKRENYIVRVAPKNRHKKHIVAANIDQALIIASFKQPQTSLGFIDRLLITTEAYHIPTTLVFNKYDLLNNVEQKELDTIKSIYEKIGYRVIYISAYEHHLGNLKDILKDKTTLLFGHSGVGKSTIVNELLPTISLKTQEVSDYSGKGTHTTTFAEMHELDFGGCIIDTPGIKEFGLIDIAPEELGGFFPEIKNRQQDCKFNNCLHQHEPHCAIQESVKTNVISLERYLSYLSILESIKN